MQHRRKTGINNMPQCLTNSTGSCVTVISLPQMTMTMMMMTAVRQSIAGAPTVEGLRNHNPAPLSFGGGG